MGKESLKFNAFTKKMGAQFTYTGKLSNHLEGIDDYEYVAMKEIRQTGRILENWVEGLKNQEENRNLSGIGKQLGDIDDMGKVEAAINKTRWKRIETANCVETKKNVSMMGKRKFRAETDDSVYPGSADKEAVKMAKNEESVNRGGECMEISCFSGEQSYSKWHIDSLVRGENGQADWRFTGFYESPYLKDKNTAWDLLRRLSHENHLPWLMVGDFNEILFGFEKKGGGQRDQGRMDAFRDTLVECQLMDIGLKMWARSFKNKREDRKKRLAKELESLLNEDRDEELMAKIIDTKIHLNMEIDKDEMYWEQRVRANWLRLEDKNSTFFHKCATVRRRENLISKLILEDGKEITTGAEINETATTFFKELFTSKGVANPDKVLDGIEVSITDEINTDLSAPFREEEI
ncbi:reverse transcriptase [Gossypium australe]|uniref:Reverse transcriptase n=1 Tax=Gossypium australe TaxID=47621 RepID=A0A5B6VDX9_9ROSI|nr:reverse transcriptase [Gossypium australe]